MVLQRGRPNPVWGWDRPGENIALTATSGAATLGTARTVAAPDGSWRLPCPELEPGGPYCLRIQGSTEAVLDDVLVGEVWLASGQSNMEFPLSRAEDGTAEATRARRPDLRVFKVAPVAAREPQPTVAGAWRVCAPETAGEFSAVGYFFARELAERLGVPVGIIDSSWGGTRVEAWTSREALDAVMDVEQELGKLALDELDLERITAQYAAAMTEWEAENLPADPGNQGEGWGWADPDYDHAAWRTLSLPAYWQALGMRFNGVVWFRRVLDLPEAWAGHDLVLSLGAIDDFDHSYFNGRLVGSHPKGTPGAYQIQRRYQVPGALVRPGRNVLSVRVFDHAGEGGFAGPADAMFVELAGGGRMPLAGDWRCEVEHRIALVPMDVFQTCPPRPAVLDRQNSPAALYNGMIAPLVPFGLRGAIWYQGESNVTEHRTYRQRFTALIRDLRMRWAAGTFPFYFVQLAGFVDSPAWPYLREAQADTLSEPATGMASAIDIGEPHDIHPRNKQEVGRRLALIALANAYHMDLECWGPVLDRVEISAEAVRVHFSHAAGLHTRGTRPTATGFELCGEDGVFQPAEARLDGATVVLECAAVPTPRAVRYAWADYPAVNLFNGAGLPAVPFRTDGF
jgi:sialate O-acetylesterase